MNSKPTYPLIAAYYNEGDVRDAMESARIQGSTPYMSEGGPYPNISEDLADALDGLESHLATLTPEDENAADELGDRLEGVVINAYTQWQEACYAE